MIIMVAGAWLLMAFDRMDQLAARGLRSLRFFTTLSNIMVAVAAAYWLAKGKTRPDKAERFKFVAAAAVFLTFTVVAFFLGPFYGYAKMYTRANFWFHLVVPVLAVVEAVFLSEYRAAKKDALICVIPTVVYGFGYLANILINGMGTWPDHYNDWYGFMSWGIPVGLVIFVFISFLTWLLARLIRFLNGKVNARRK